MNFIKTIFGAESTQYESTIERMKRVTHEMTGNLENQFKKVGAAIGTYLSFNAIKGAIDDAIRYFDNLAHKAEQIGVSAAFLQTFEHAMRSVGGSSQQADKAVADFSKKVGEAMSGTGALAGILDRLGIALYATDGSARSITAIMGDYADAIANAASPQEKLYLSGKAFGEEAGPKMVEVLKNGAAGMNEMVAAFAKAHPNFDETAKRLSAASQALEDIRTKMTIFVGETLGYWLEKFSSFDNAVLESKRLFGDVFFGIGQLWANVAKTLTFGLIDFTDKVLELRIKFDGWLMEGHQKTMQANAEQKGAIDSATESVNRQVTAIENVTTATKEAANEAKALATIEQRRFEERVLAEETMRGALKSEIEANKEINAQKDRQFQSDYGIVDRLYQQGFELQEIVNKYPRLLEAAQSYSNLTGDTVTDAETLKKEIEAATAATNDLADAAGRVKYGPGPGAVGGGGGPGPGGGGGGGGDGTSTGNIGTPDPNWRNADGLANTGSGGGYFGTFNGMGDVSQMSAEDIIRASRELEKQLLDLKLNATKSMDFMQIEKTYVRNIEDILKKLNEELYVRAKAEVGGKGIVPQAGFMSPEQYFKKLDDFIEKLYAKETDKDTSNDKQKKSVDDQVNATKKLAVALDRFGGAIERNIGKGFGVGFRP